MTSLVRLTVNADNTRYSLAESFSIPAFFTLANNIVRSRTSMDNNIQSDIVLLQAVSSTFQEIDRRSQADTYCRRISQVFEILLSIINSLKTDSIIHQRPSTKTNT